ncbi:MAG: threonylcarbamoyl-AMP synthase [Acidobacteria bacterium]|nr:threonylcarbamoyl-AMP synthase [Acidobacteriota bacterium]
MKTVLTADPLEAAAFIRDGKIVAFPTETVYGLGAAVFDEAAIEKIFRAKNRPADNPLIAHICDTTQLSLLTRHVGALAELLINHFFPGPLTVVLQKSDAVPFIATAGLQTIGIRMPKLPVANQFLRACQTPVVAPSANMSGRPSPTTWQAVFEDLNGRIDSILQGDATYIGIESTVVDCTGEIPIILRKGAVSIEAIREVVPETIMGANSRSESPRSPGLNHKHYAPRARVVLVHASSQIELDYAAFIGLHDPGLYFQLKLICPTLEEYARNLFEFFRECDRQKIATIYCETVNEQKIGAALMDRLRRAAEN